MSMTSWMIRHRNLRSNRFKREKENDPDSVKLDLSKDPNINLLEILNSVCFPTEHSECKLINYLNAYIKLISHIKCDFDILKFTPEDVFCCLRVPVVHDGIRVRTAALRALRYTLKTVEHVKIINKLLFPQLISRSLDLVSHTDIERIQAMKLIRRILLVSPRDFDLSLTRSLVSLANGSPEEKDRMLRACLAALSELAILNSELFISASGVLVIVRNILECQTPRIAESLCGTLLHLLNHPYTRDLAAIDLQCLAAPYCDFHFGKRNLTSSEKSEMAEERDIRFNCSRLALLSVLRSWPGILHFCNPTNPTCLKAMVDILYLEHLEVKNAVLDLLYELLNLPQPEWTDEFSVALKAVDPADPQESWRLGDGFVAAEAKSILPHLAKTTPNLVEIHLATLLYIFIEVGLLNALAEVIMTGDTFIRVRATVLLGELLDMSHQLLPPDCCNITPSLPNLIMHATDKYQALAAVSALQNLHTMMKQRPASFSLFLDHILLSSNYFKTNKHHSLSRLKSLPQKSKLYQLIVRDSESLLRDSVVLQNKDGFRWNWDIIRTILKDNIDSVQKLEESNHKAFIKRLVHYFKPSSNKFSHIDLSSERYTQKCTLAGCDLINYLLIINEAEGFRLLWELFADISTQIKAISSSKSAHDCLFSPQHMFNTCCQKYFLFIGHLTHTARGIDILTRLEIFDELLKLSTTMNHDCYAKLIISSMDYTTDAYPRKILTKTLKCNLKPSRLYSTQFLLVLLRVKMVYFEQWGIQLLVNQLYDQSKAVSLAALNILHEACEEKLYIDKLVSLKPDLLSLGDKGLLLLIRFLSTPKGYTLLQTTNFIENEIMRWMNNYNYRYVRIVEEELHDCLTLHQRNEVGHYNSRISSVKTVFRRDMFLPPHICGQLVQHIKGFNKLTEVGNLNTLFQCVEHGICYTEQEILELKAALWACGHIATSTMGVDLLLSNNILNYTVNIAKTCPVYAVRGTAVYVLGLMGTTHKGANELFKLGWVCTRHDRHERWPIIEGEKWYNEEFIETERAPTTSVAECESDKISDNSSSHYWNDERQAGDFFVADPEGSTADEDIFFKEENVMTSHQKSSTLPHESSLTTPKHERSLSESKTVEVLATQPSDQTLKVAGRLNSQNSVTNQHRHRDCSESSTSGVSSCDSVAGKYLFGERIPTLSPIPSSSSLSTLKSSSVFAHQRRRSEYINRIIENAQLSDVPCTRLSHQDLLGYTTFRSLGLHRKPLYSESSLDELTATLNKDKTKLSSSLGSKSAKGKTLDRQNTQLSLSEGEGSPFPNQILSGISSSSLTSILKLTSSLRINDKNGGPCYMGIALPKNILDLFPNEQINVSSIFKTTESDDSLKYNSSLETDDYRNIMIHNTSTCLNCSVKNIKSQQQLWDVFLTNCQKENEQSTSSSQVKPLTETHDVILKMDILKFIERLANPVWYKQSKQMLLQLKQKHPYIFQDVCLYSEACNVVRSISIKLMARRFFQELFQDLNFDLVNKEPVSILNTRKTDIEENVNQVPNTSIEQSSNDSNKEDSVKSIFLKDYEERCADLADLLQTDDSENKVVVISTENKKIIKGFTIESQHMQHSSSSDNKDTNNENNDNHLAKSSAPIRSPPLASVKEETLSSVENLLESDLVEEQMKSKIASELQETEKDNQKESHEKTAIIKSNKTSVNSLCLTCSQNKFPITKRYQDLTGTTSKGYSFPTALISPTSTKSPPTIKTNSDTIKAEQISSINGKSLQNLQSTETHFEGQQLDSVSTTQCVPTPKINTTP